jgi:hypothetical protein
VLTRLEGVNNVLQPRVINLAFRNMAPVVVVVIPEVHALPSMLVRSRGEFDSPARRRPRRDQYAVTVIATPRVSAIEKPQNIKAPRRA